MNSTECTIVYDAGQENNLLVHQRPVAVAAVKAVAAVEAVADVSEHCDSASFTPRSNSLFINGVGLVDPDPFS